MPSPNPPTPRIYRDADASLDALAGERIAVLGYGNQGRAQALNLRDSGLDVVIGVRADETRARAVRDGFVAHEPAEAVRGADVVMLLLPDEVMPDVFHEQVRPLLRAGACVEVASGYNVAFGHLELPADVDVVMVAPRMIGPGVREMYLSGRSFPSFVAVHQDATGRARARMLAIARGIGSTRAGCLELSCADEAALDLFNEQGFGPAFGMALTNAIGTLIEAGFPPEAVLLEILHSGELAYTLGRMVRDGIVDQMDHHSHTSQYGSMTRALRFLDLDVRSRMQRVLEEIRSGAFAREWSEERRKGMPLYSRLREARLQHPVREWEARVRAAFALFDDEPREGDEREAG
jgi:ketol-acid reductoisomerase